jgi:hypothetical protein
MPGVKEKNVQGILYALSDPVQVRIYADLARADSAMTDHKTVRTPATANITRQNWPELAETLSRRHNQGPLIFFTSYKAKSQTSVNTSE